MPKMPWPMFPKDPCRKSARQAESRGLLIDAFACYRRGLQHLIRVLPVLDSRATMEPPWCLKVIFSSYKSPIHITHLPDDILHCFHQSGLLISVCFPRSFFSLHQVDFPPPTATPWSGEGQRPAGAGAEDGQGQLGTGGPGEGEAEPTEAGGGRTALRSMDKRYARGCYGGGCEGLQKTDGEPVGAGSF